MRNQDAINKTVNGACTPIPLPVLDVQISLVNFPALAHVLHCINNKTGFGLQCKSSTIIFDPEKLVVYDYTSGKLNKTICRNDKDFINYLKMAAIEHRTFISSIKCIEIVKQKRIEK